MHQHLLLTGGDKLSYYRKLVRGQSGAGCTILAKYRRLFRGQSCARCTTVATYRIFLSQSVDILLHDL